MSANLTQLETADRAAAITLHSYRVDVDVREAVSPEVPGYPVVATIELSATGDTWLDFIGESVAAVTVDGEARDVDYDGARIRLTGLPEGRCTVRVEATASRASRPEMSLFWTACHSCLR